MHKGGGGGGGTLSEAECLQSAMPKNMFGMNRYVFSQNTLLYGFYSFAHKLNQNEFALHNLIFSSLLFYFIFAYCKWIAYEICLKEK